MPVGGGGLALGSLVLTGCVQHLLWLLWTAAFSSPPHPSPRCCVQMAWEWMLLRAWVLFRYAAPLPSSSPLPPLFLPSSSPLPPLISQ